jgi:molybdate transport system ATP-binding protein
VKGLEAHASVQRGTFTLDIDLSVPEGETVGLMGPNGSGKSTLVEILAGTLAIDRGEIQVAGNVWAATLENVSLPPQSRSVGVMFQGLLLFPSLSVLDNVAFGLRAQGMARAVAREQAGAVLARFGLDRFSDRRPQDLSGGQAQRVALARALVVEPDLLLLDEPMSALDVAVRAAARRELREALEAFEGTKLVVTHEPREAMALSDRLVVLEEGRVVQHGSAADLRTRPKTAYIASLVGVNLFSGVVLERDGHRVLRTSGGDLAIAADVEPGNEVLAMVHPRAISLMTHPEPSGVSFRNVLEMRVEEIDLMGDRARIHLDGQPSLTAEITTEALGELDLRKDVRVWAAIKATQVDVYE